MLTKLTNVPNGVYARILAIDNLTLLQRAQMMAAVGINVVAKTPIVILNRAGKFLCEVYDVTAEEFQNMGVEIKNRTEDEVGVIALAKRAIRAPFIAIKHGAITVYRIVIAAVDNFTGIFNDLIGVGRDVKATMVCRFNPIAANLLFQQMQTSTEADVQAFISACGLEALKSVQEAVAPMPNIKMPEAPSFDAMPKAPHMVDINGPDFQKHVESALQKLMASPLNVAAAGA